MKFHKSLFGKSGKSSPYAEAPPEKPVPEEFPSWVRSSIDLIVHKGSGLQDPEMVALLTEGGIPAHDAEQIVLLLPVVFTRAMFPQIKWPKRYVEFHLDGRRIRRYYHTNNRYRIMQEVSQQYFSEKPPSKDITNVALRSAESQLINQILLQAPESDLSELRLTEAVLLTNHS